MLELERTCKTKGRQIQDFIKKLFTTPSSGKHWNWSNNGIVIVDVCKGIERLRNNPAIGKEFENSLLKHYHSIDKQYLLQQKKQHMTIS